MTAPFLRLLPPALLSWTVPAAVGAWRLIAGLRRALAALGAHLVRLSGA
jgi:hypothetical protein